MARPGAKQLLRPDLGLGIGLRSSYIDELLEREKIAGLDLLEIVAENFLDAPPALLGKLERLRERYAFALHGVALSLGGCDPLDDRHLAGLKELADRLDVAFVSEHAAWSSAGGVKGHDLYPLPRNEESLANLVARIRNVQDRLERQILVENAASYLVFRDTTMSEGTFLARMAEEADCGLLLDLSNLVVNAHNEGFDPIRDVLDKLPLERLALLHVAGFEDRESHFFDAHDGPVADEVRALHRLVVGRAGPRPTLLERDANLPPLDEIVAEMTSFGGQA